MNSNYLYSLFNPRSIAIIGASDREDSIGLKVYSNLINENFSGKLYPVNPKHTHVQGQPCFPSVNAIENIIDLAVIVTPADTVPNILVQCGEKGIGAAIIISAGFSETGESGKKLEEKLLAIAHRYNIHLIGPNCLGIMLPHINLNATFNNVSALPGSLSLISQSGAICAAILDWAKEKDIGFSSVISLGNALDLDFSNALDYFAVDPKTESILLYIEGIRHARHFLSSLRTAARMKPVVVIKGGRLQQGSRAALSHTGAIVGRDDVFDAALKRAGAIRVMSIQQIFSAAQILASKYRTKGNRLAIVTNGGGAGVMAADRAEELKLSIPAFEQNTTNNLNKTLPHNWSHQNPVDILGDATPARYSETISACINDSNIDGIVTILVPVAMSKPHTVAKETIASAEKTKKPLIACWMGGKQVHSARKLFAKYLLPCYETPEAAVEAFSYLANFYHNQQLLLQVPKPLSHQKPPDINRAQAIINNALSENRKVLTLVESKELLTAFEIPVSQSIIASTANEARKAAEKLGFPVVMKIHSFDITHKQDVGGVKLNITKSDSVEEIFSNMLSNVKHKIPDAKILGVTIEKMYSNPNNRELMIGIISDHVFGPVISFGAGGSLVEITQDIAIELPPLNPFLARRLIAHTRIAKALDQFRNMPAVNLVDVENFLLRVSEMICHLPQIKEMDINPVLINDSSMVAIDARIILAPYTPKHLFDHLAIHPYPDQLISNLKLADRTAVTIRPIRPEDAQIEQEFMRGLSSQSKYFRFGEYLHELSPEMLVRFTQIDYDREMAFIAVIEEDGKEKNLGVARYMSDPGQKSCEFAIVVANGWQGKGIATHLMSKLIDTAKDQGFEVMHGEINSTNNEMLLLARNLGFSIEILPNDATVKIATKTL